MDAKKFRLVLYAVIIAQLSGMWWWLRHMTIPLAHAMYHHDHDPATNLISGWTLGVGFSGAIIAASSWMLQEYLACRIRHARKKYQAANELLQSIQKAPRRFQPEERIDAIDTFQARELELRRAKAKRWFGEVHDQLFFIGAMLFLVPLLPFLFLLFEAVRGKLGSQ